MAGALDDAAGGRGIRADFVRSSGPEDAPPLVLLPGIGSPGLTFSQNVAELATRFRVHAVDIHDHGRSVEREDGPVKDMADFVHW
ncbi:MAG: hypothetical protein IT380_27285 [Myxococcales bacterium]|nr:hypothetical protein [Myxococcales bacterium]